MASAAPTSPVQKTAVAETAVIETKAKAKTKSQKALYHAVGEIIEGLRHALAEITEHEKQIQSLDEEHDNHAEKIAECQLFLDHLVECEEEFGMLTEQEQFEYKKARSDLDAAFTAMQGIDYQKEELNEKLCEAMVPYQQIIQQISSFVIEGLDGLPRVTDHAAAWPTNDEILDVLCLIDRFRELLPLCETFKTVWSCECYNDVRCEYGYDSRHDHEDDYKYEAAKAEDQQSYCIEESVSMLLEKFSEKYDMVIAPILSLIVEYRSYIIQEDAKTTPSTKLRDIQCDLEAADHGLTKEDVVSLEQLFLNVWEFDFRCYGRRGDLPEPTRNAEFWPCLSRYMILVRGCRPGPTAETESNA